MIFKKVSVILLVKLVSDLIIMNAYLVSLVHHEYTKVRLIHVLAL